MRQALLALLETVPLEDVTGVMVAGEANVGYATFFRHYADVRELLADTVAALAEDLSARMIPVLLTAGTSAAARELIQEVAERRAVFGALLAGAGDSLRGILMRHVALQMESLPDLSPSWLPNRLAVRFAVAGTIEVIDWWLLQEPERDPAQVAAVLDRLVIGMFSHTPD